MKNSNEMRIIKTVKTVAAIAAVIAVGTSVDYFASKIEVNDFEVNLFYEPAVETETTTVDVTAFATETVIPENISIVTVPPTVARASMSIAMKDDPASRKAPPEVTGLVSKKNPNPDWDGSIDPTEITGMNTEVFDKLIDRIIKERDLSTDTNPMHGHGLDLVAIEENYNVNALTCLAIWTWESGLGESDVAHDYNNYGGITRRSGGYKHYNDTSEGMQDQGRVLADIYFANGKDTYATIAKPYCPYAYERWTKKVKGFAETYSEYLMEILEDYE